MEASELIERLKLCVAAVDSRGTMVLGENAIAAIIARLEALSSGEAVAYRWLRVEFEGGREWPELYHGRDLPLTPGINDGYEIRNVQPLYTAPALSSRFTALGAGEQFAENAKKYPPSARKLRTAVVLHLEADGTPTLKVWDTTGEILALWIDESAQGDRVYEQTHRETDISTLRALIGPDRIGNSADGHLDDQTVQAIRAMHWRRDGGRLVAVEEPDDE